MKPAGGAISSGSRALRTLRNVVNDELYRGQLYLLANTVATSAIGFVFWTLAAHRYSAPTVGVFSSLTSGASLLAAIAALGLPITMTRHITNAERPLELVLVSIMTIATVGTLLCLVTLLFLGPHLPAELHIQQRGSMAILVTVFVVFTALGGTLDAGLIATRSTRTVLIKNLVGSIVKLVAMLALVALRSSGLLISFGLGLVLATMLGGVSLGRRLKGKGIGFRSFRAPWHYLSVTSGNYVATVIGILPLSIVPIEVLAVRGAAQTARFSIAFLIAGFLNFIPSTMGQVLFAELARGGAPLGKQFRKALRAVYSLLLPSIALLLVTAPFVLRLFGKAYEAEATSCLRILALSSLAAGGTYLVDSLLIARDRTAAYTFMQIANAALVLGGVGILLRHGLAAGASGWAVAQGLTLVLGLLVLATGRTGRHHPTVAAVRSGSAHRYAEDDQRPWLVGEHFEPQIRELLATWPMMPTTLIAEQIGWDRSIHVLLDRVTELRSAYSDASQYVTRTRYLAGESAQCGLWFPPTEIPVGFGQTRSAQQLPVLTMITGYSRWLLAMLIPSSHSKDVLAGLWDFLVALGAVPQVLTWESDDVMSRWRAGKLELTNEWDDFCAASGAEFVVGRPADAGTRGLIERAHAYLERSFLTGRTFASPDDFNEQLGGWLDATNTRKRDLPDRSPIDLIDADRQDMLPLPPIAPPQGWHLSMRVGSDALLRFDSNAYSVHPATIGRRVDLLADLSQIRVLCDSEIVAEHDRAWTRQCTIRHPAHGPALVDAEPE